MKKPDEPHNPATCRSGFFCDKCKEFLAKATPDEKIDYILARLVRIESTLGRLTWRA